MLKVGIIIGTTRPNRNGEAVGKWVYQLTKRRTDAEFVLLDLKDFDLPLLDEPMSASFGQYHNAHTKKWSEAISACDAFIFITAEYNHSVTGALKNAIDYLSNEWKNKAAGFVGYGGLGGARAIEHLRAIMGELEIADVRTQVSLSLMTDFEHFQVFKPASFHEKSVHKMLDEVIAWGTALQLVRTEKRIAQWSEESL